MLKFLTYENGAPAANYRLRNAYLIGADGNPMRGQIAVDGGAIVCEKREAGSVALAVLHDVGDLGRLTLQTCLLPERAEPYLLSLELARHRLMTLYTKLEEWAMFDLEADHPVSKRAERARNLFVEALCLQNDDPAQADRVAQQCLEISLDGSEELALAHSDVLLTRRRETNAVPRIAIGCGIGLDQGHDRLRASIKANFDMLALPTPWRALAPNEDEYRWQMMDRWIDWAARQRVPVMAGPIISFDPANLPDWLYIWEHDYDTIRELAYEHVHRVVERYKGVVSGWTIVSGLHINDHFTFNFEQIMDLSRMVAMQVKRVQPGASTMVEIRQPFGEYYSSNPRSIPPMMYADLLVQSSLTFDAFSIELLVGQACPGQYARDLMQVSNVLDQFAALGKPLMFCTAAPSSPVTEPMLPGADSNQAVDADAGYWRRPWSQLVQSHWLEAVLQIALSKPFVESIVWHDLVDHPNIGLPLSALIAEDFQPKKAFSRLVQFRRELSRRTSASTTSSPASVTGDLEQAPNDAQTTDDT